MQKKNTIYAGKTTLRDIAEKAGVSVTTVSLVLKDAETARAGAETRKRILKIAEEMKYSPNYSLKSPAGKESHTIGVVITTLSNPFYAEITEDIIQSSKSIGYSVIISSTRGGIIDERQAVFELLDRGVEGLIICSVYRKDSIPAELTSKEIPFVLTLRSIVTNPMDVPVDSIVVDNERGGYMAMEHLIKMGHKEIGIIAGDQETSTGHDRLIGAITALEKYDIEYSPDLILQGDFRRETGRLLARKLLIKPNRPTAIFAHNDHMAIGVFDALREKGMRVPQDMALIGFDDIEIAGVPGVDLSTISQKKSIMGRLAVDILFDRIRGNADHVTKNIILDPILIIRESCGFNAAGRNYKKNLGSIGDVRKITHR